MGLIVFDGHSQNVGIDVINPQARLEIKGLNILGTSQSLLVKNFNNDSLLKVSNNGVVGIGSMVKDFSQLRIINNGKLNPHLVLQGTNFGPGTGRFFSSLLFTDTNFTRSWSVNATVYGQGSGDLNHSRYGDLVIGNDSLPSALHLNGEGRLRIGSNYSTAGFFQVAGDWLNNPPAPGFTPHINLIGTGVGSRAYQTFTSSDGVNQWRFIAHHSPSGFENSFFSIQLDALAETGIIFGGNARAHMGNGIDRGKFTINHTGTATNAHLVLYDQTNTYSRLQFQNSGSTNYWNVSAWSSNTNANARMNFTNNVTGDILSITGDGKLGVGTTSPHVKTTVQINGSATADTTPLILNNIKEYANNAIAVAAGLPVGSIYRTGDLLKIVH